MKICCTCKGKPQPLHNFYKDKGTKDGYEARCKVCRKESVKETRSKRLEYYREKTNAWGKANREKCREYEKAWYDSHKEQKKEAATAWRQRNLPKWNALSAASVKKLRKSRPDLFRAWAAAKRAKLLQRMPSWANKKMLALVYKNRPPGKVVDHMVPLMGKNVSGLHVAWNLQYLTPLENGIKSNKF